MVSKLREIVGALKDKASQTKASLLCNADAAAAATTTSTPIISPHLAVLRATPHNPPFDPPHPHHLSTLLSFGSSPRPAAAALLSSLTSRLVSTRNASVALKSLLALHHLYIHGAFILRDQLSTALSRPSGSRHPLHLSSFRDPSSSPQSWTMSSWVRWFAGVLELLLLASPLSTDHNDSISSLLNPDLLSELTSLVQLLLESRRSPPFPIWEGNALVREVVRVVADDSVAAEHAILLRVREVRERLGSLDYAESIELLCLLRRLEDEVEDKDKLMPSDLNRRAEDSFWDEIKGVRERIGELVMKREFDKNRVRRDRVGESDRINIRFGFIEPSRFGSFRLY